VASVRRADDGACAASAEAQGGARMVSSMSPIGPERHLVRRSEMSGVEVKADSKSMASFGRS
jgi:hypothetical protein